MWEREIFFSQNVEKRESDKIRRALNCQNICNIFDDLIFYFFPLFCGNFYLLIWKRFFFNDEVSFFSFLRLKLDFWQFFWFSTLSPQNRVTVKKDFNWFLLLRSSLTLTFLHFCQMRRILHLTSSHPFFLPTTCHWTINFFR